MSLEERVNVYHWYPKQEIIDYIIQIETKEFKNEMDVIYELYDQAPCIPRLTYSIPYTREKLIDRYYEYLFSHNAIEKIDHIELYMESIGTYIKNGFICTTSPLIEILRYTQNQQNYTGHILNRFFIWTDESTNTLHILPKLGIIEYNIINSKLKTEFLEYAKDPIYWNNYYNWGGAKEDKFAFKFHRLEANFDSTKYFEMVYQGIVKSQENTKIKLSYINNLLNNLKEHDTRMLSKFNDK